MVVAVNVMLSPGIELSNSGGAKCIFFRRLRSGSHASAYRFFSSALVLLFVERSSVGG